ncbi:hypothetical protein GLOIN_2v1709174 [Rhizophagus irregularis DAOM 181602=DAOM 197198]|uniref:Uncharacterized protein n=1 Tax=Rhizophagus irregularis (strain DAOM 181602 / DAOM 197198 / MUCL 43194) TaxID=747089 RepID=A0A2P4P646_RHIID|nr:hypothetical protein GLOIN_2v1709174 [Rhizophagus irregularis DAOM 181602=DAOM 197198]POG60850.1 hypothetical protein GLOIN_2v1709174 [Rhizophagus irregularis DAOM 181602=DAOM 197198]|eukprot:XP_025167716.1 hypothetical protein GLOIN_2v1709174 [Rhizophagus irregularis DAOM 181602=DAOM 197198]
MLLQILLGVLYYKPHNIQGNKHVLQNIYQNSIHPLYFRLHGFYYIWGNVLNY